jgi:hypothetical protein
MCPQPIRLLQPLLKRVHPSRLFRCSGSRKCVHIAFRHLETSLRRLPQNSFLKRPKGTYCVLRPNRLLEISLTRIYPSRFFDPQDSEKDFARTFDTLKHWSIDFVNVVRKADYESTGPFTYLKHHKQVAFFVVQSPENEFACPFDTLKHRFIDFNKVVFSRRPEGRISVLNPIRLLKISLSYLVEVDFFYARDAENEFVWPFETLKHRLNIF